ncbi:hypothetical protein RIF29_28076 [Crotalaria pallida]|uniref:C3H1-type domain-containing protein n=1 Tax=Crotalaria pallida TaxID=3830 RepID=A0AAN9I113_CROPI
MIACLHWPRPCKLCLCASFTKCPSRIPVNIQNDDDVVPGEKRKRDDNDDRSLHLMWKTSLCSYFRRQDKACSHGDTCCYAHSEEELRPRPGNTWDPTSERAKKALKTETEEKRSVSDDVMVTEALIDDGGDDDAGSSNALSKCLVHLPMRWCSEKLRSFLNVL